MEKEIIWTAIGGDIWALIPKKRGQGFVKVPYGHHVDPGLEDVRTQLGEVDIFGLDGHLEIVLSPKLRRPEVWEELKAKSIRLLEAHYGCPARESLADFTKHHPVKTWDNWSCFENPNS